MSRNMKRAALTAAAIASSMVWIGGAPAAADAWGVTEINDPISNKLKASSWYFDGINKVCIKAWNSIDSAYAEIWVRNRRNGDEIHFKDFGGDDVENCRSAPLSYNGDIADVKFQHRNSNEMLTDEPKTGSVIY